MDLLRPKQPIALPLDSENEKLVKDSPLYDPEFTVSPAPQQECARRCCFKKGSRGRKAIRRVGHLLIIGALFYWFWKPSVNLYRGFSHGPQDIDFTDFADLEEIPGVVPEDFLWAAFIPEEHPECDQQAEWSEPKKIKHPPCKGHHGHRKPHPPGEPEPPHNPDDPEPPQHPDGPEPRNPGGPEPDHPHEPGHPHKPDHPHKPHHPHWPGRPGHPHRRRHGPKYTTDATFKLPLSDSHLLFYSHGPGAFGGIKFYQDESDSLKSDEVEVTINAKIWDKTALDHAKVCSLKLDHGAGLGIWTEPPKHHKREERKKRELVLRIAVKFPKNPDTLELEKLETHLPLFAHFFKDADLKIKELDVASFFLPIKSEALNVERGKVRTENSVIVGNFTASDLLVLETKNAPIVANVTLWNDPEKKSADETDEHPEFSKVFIKTSNSAIHANISLHSTAKNHDGGKFIVGAFTSNSPLHVGFPEAPVDSVLRFHGHTSNSPAIAVLHPTYQGEFNVKSSLFGPKLEVNPKVEDPSGEGRHLTVDSKKVGKDIVGKVFWGDEEESKHAFGHVELGSTLLSAVLKLGG